jgi:hypothetical protein
MKNSAKFNKSKSSPSLKNIADKLTRDISLLIGGGGNDKKTEENATNILTNLNKHSKDDNNDISDHLLTKIETFLVTNAEKISYIKLDLIKLHLVDITLGTDVIKKGLFLKKIFDNFTKKAGLYEYDTEIFDDYDYEKVKDKFYTKNLLLTIVRSLYLILCNNKNPEDLKNFKKKIAMYNFTHSDEMMKQINKVSKGILLSLPPQYPPPPSPSPSPSPSPPPPPLSKKEKIIIRLKDFITKNTSNRLQYEKLTKFENSLLYLEANKPNFILKPLTDGKQYSDDVNTNLQEYNKIKEMVRIDIYFESIKYIHKYFIQYSNNTIIDDNVINKTDLNIIESDLQIIDRQLKNIDDNLIQMKQRFDKLLDSIKKYENDGKDGDDDDKDHGKDGDDEHEEEDGEEDGGEDEVDEDGKHEEEQEEEPISSSDTIEEKLQKFATKFNDMLGNTNNIFENFDATYLKKISNDKEEFKIEMIKLNEDKRKKEEETNALKNYNDVVDKISALLSDQQTEQLFEKYFDIKYNKIDIIQTHIKELTEEDLQNLENIFLRYSTLSTELKSAKEEIDKLIKKNYTSNKARIARAAKIFSTKTSNLVKLMTPKQKKIKDSKLDDPAPNKMFNGKIKVLRKETTPDILQDIYNRLIILEYNLQDKQPSKELSDLIQDKQPSKELSDLIQEYNEVNKDYIDNLTKKEIELKELKNKGNKKYLNELLEKAESQVKNKNNEINDNIAKINQDNKDKVNGKKKMIALIYIKTDDGKIIWKDKEKFIKEVARLKSAISKNNEDHYNKAILTLEQEIAEGIQKIKDLKDKLNNFENKTTGGKVSKYKSTGNKVYILYKKRKYKKTIYVKENTITKYCKINDKYYLLSKLKIIEDI